MLPMKHLLLLLVLLLVPHTSAVVYPTIKATKVVISRGLSQLSDLKSATSRLQIAELIYDNVGPSTKTPFPVPVKSITKKGSSQSGIFAPICRSVKGDAKKTTTVTVAWNDHYGCTSKADFYLCSEKGSKIKAAALADPKICKKVATGVAKGTDFTWTAPETFFMAAKMSKDVPVKEEGVTTYLYAIGTGTISTATTSTCKARPATTTEASYATSFKDRDCDHYLAEIQADKDRIQAAKDAKAKEEADRQKKIADEKAAREAQPFYDFLTFVFVWVPLMLSIAWCLLEVYKRKEYMDADKLYTTPFYSATMANAPSVEVTNPSMDLKNGGGVGTVEVTVTAGETKSTDKGNQDGVMQSNCPKCDESIVRPVNDAVWQCKYCGCHVTLSPLKDEFINVDDGIAR
jgi:ribosomal protein L37AE/L43A